MGSRPIQLAAAVDRLDGAAGEILERAADYVGGLQADRGAGFGEDDAAAGIVHRGVLEDEPGRADAFDGAVVG